MQKENGFVNIYIDIETKKIFSSTYPYQSKQEAEKAIFIGLGIEKVGCVEIKYSKYKEK